MAMAVTAMVMAMLLANALHFPSGAMASTFPVDLEALKQVKAAIDPASIHSTTCLGSWDFSAADPCDSRSTTQFVCGIGCTSDDPLNRRVVSLILDGSGYVGSLPSAIGRLSALQVLDISGNSFQGPIPDTVGQLSRLIKLDMSRNSFSGTIPDALGGLSNLSYLSLANNKLTGTIPPSISSLSSLQRLFLYNNRLHGQIPPMSTLGQLSYFDASNNELAELPDGLPPSLMQLSLRANKLSGQFPPQLATQLQGLEVLDLSFNNLAGELDPSLFELPSLQQLTVSHNQITSIGQPHLSAADSSELVAFDVSYNLVHGPLPVFLARLKRLSALSLRYNTFSGTIPYEFAAKANSSDSSALQPLSRLFLDGNYLVGEVPAPFLRLEGFSASFVYNCLSECPGEFSFCRGAGQRPKSQCPTL